MKAMTAILDKQIYSDLLSQVQPKVIETEEENEQFLAEVEKLMAIGEELTLEQEYLLKLLVSLVEQFESEHYQLKPVTPLEILNELITQHNLKQKDLIPVFGSQGTASEVIDGKRSISKAHTKALGDFFHLSPTLFFAP